MAKFGGRFFLPICVFKIIAIVKLDKIFRKFLAEFDHSLTVKSNGEKIKDVIIQK